MSLAAASRGVSGASPKRSSMNVSLMAVSGQLALVESEGLSALRDRVRLSPLLGIYPAGECRFRFRRGDVKLAALDQMRTFERKHRMVTLGDSLRGRQRNRGLHPK